ncbi:MAG: type II secretion system protein [Lachnospiraceae bacterium]|nr:type II secretion system protein [Lachnospiraceae bacterium]
MKKMNNKGFSLVELIIVIAIMAILAGAIAPALIRYIDKSRKSNDISSAKTIKTAVETAMANEDTYELLTTGTTASITDEDSNVIVYNGNVTITPGSVTNNNGTGITLTVKGSVLNKVAADVESAAKTEIGKNIGEKTPKLKFKKDPADGTDKPDKFNVYCTAGGNVVVGMTTSGNKFYQLAPDVSKYYQ